MEKNKAKIGCDILSSYIFRTWRGDNYFSRLDFHFPKKRFQSVSNLNVFPPWVVGKWKTTLRVHSLSTSISFSLPLIRGHCHFYSLLTTSLSLLWLLTLEPFFISKHLSVWSKDSELIDFNILIVTVRGKGEEGWDIWRWSMWLGLTANTDPPATRSNLRVCRLWKTSKLPSCACELTGCCHWLRCS